MFIALYFQLFKTLVFQDIVNPGFNAPVNSALPQKM